MLNLSEFKFYWDLQRDERGEGERKEGRGKRKGERGELEKVEERESGKTEKTIRA